MYNPNFSYTVTTSLHGKYVAMHEFSDKKEAAEWFKKASTDPEWFGPGFHVVLRHRGRVIKEKVAA
jgi:hypothetical protein